MFAHSFIHSFIHDRVKYFLFFGLLLSLPLLSTGQTSTDEVAELPFRAIGLTPTEIPIVQKGLSLLTKDSLVYLVIHGAGSSFKIFQKNTWKTLSPLSVAKWISDSIAYEPKNIVLLSCSDSVSNQKLANALGLLDQAAKRKKRKIIAWDETVEFYENGYIRGYGTCRSFESNLSALRVPIPLGTGLSPQSTTPSVLLTPSTPQTKAIRDLASKGTTMDEIKTLLKSWGNFRTNFISNNQKDAKVIQPDASGHLFIVNVEAVFEAWLFLKQTAKVDITPLTGYAKSLAEVKMILDKSIYKVGDLKAGYPAADIQKAFIDYFKDGKNPLLTVTALAESTTAIDFMDIITNAGTTKSITTLFPTGSPLLAAKLTDPNLIFTKNQTILADAKTQKKFVEVLKGFVKKETAIPINTVGLVNPSNPIVPAHGNDLEILKAALTDLRVDWAGSVQNVIGARSKITNRINKSMGEKMTYHQLLRLTASGMVFEASGTKGSLFEHWAFQKLNADIKQLGYKLERKNPDRIDKNDDGIIVDFYYTLPNDNIVAVEMKHAIDVPQYQLDDRKALLVSGTLSYVYIFAEKPFFDPLKYKTLSDAPVVRKIRITLGEATKIYYFLNGVLTPIP